MNRAGWSSHHFGKGIVAGDVEDRKLVSKTIVWQLTAAVETATGPHQCALSTKAGAECIAHMLQSLTELYPEATVTSNGISAYDLISREATLQGLARLDGALSEYLWEDESGTSCRIPQGEGGEQGDALMPSLFCLGQHEALRASQEQLREGEHLLAFMDDIYMVTLPDRVGPVCVCESPREPPRPRLHSHSQREDKGLEQTWHQTSGV